MYTEGGYVSFSVCEKWSLIEPQEVFGYNFVWYKHLLPFNKYGYDSHLV